MKKQALRILSLLTAALLTLPLIGCLVPKQAEEPSEPAQSGEVQAPEGLDPQDAPAAEFDMNAVGIELGEIKITAGEIRDTFDQYVSMFAYSYGYDAEMLEQYLRMTEEWLIEYYVPEWKAKDLGIALSAEKEAEIAQEAQRLTDEERDEILLLFASEFADIDDDVEDASALTADQLVATVAAINEELAAMGYGDDYTFDDYLAMRREGYESSARADLLSELLAEQVRTALLSDPAAIDAWYETTLAAQKETYDADPTRFLDDRNAAGALPCLYAPLDAAQLELICVREDETPDDALAEGEDGLKALEAEYGALKLNGENEARQAEIETEYAALKAKVEALRTAQDGAAQALIDKAYADLTGGMSFEDAMNAYNTPDENGSARLSFTIFLSDAEPDHPELIETAAALEPGKYSEPICIDGAYYIVRLVERIPAGTILRSSIEEAIRESIKSGTAGDDAWAEQFDAWLEEAKAAAVYHRETYASVVDTYLFSDN